MNRFQAQVTKIVACDRLHQVNLKMHVSELTIVTLQLPKDLEEGADVTLLVKPTQILLATAAHDDLSFDNRLSARITAIEKGEILTTVQLDTNQTQVEAIITTKAVERLRLKKGQNCFIGINAASFSIGAHVDG
jgi:molybdopterin-binding protein